MSNTVSVCIASPGGPYGLTLRCNQNKAIKKNEPAAFLINEYISSRVVARILGSEYNNSISVLVNPDNTLHLEIPIRHSSFLPIHTSTSPLLSNGAFINKIPAAIMIGFCQIDKDFTSFTVSNSNKYEFSKVDNKPILNFFSSYLATVMVHDADHGGLLNFALIELEDSYVVLPLDFDDSLSFLYKMNPPLIQRKPISAFYPRETLAYVFSSNMGAGISPAALTNPITGNFLDRESGQVVPQYNVFPSLGKKMIDVHTKLDLLPLESAFARVLNTPFTYIAQEIEESFAHVKSILPASLLSVIYEEQAIQAAAKKPFDYYYQNLDNSYDFISSSDINKSLPIAQHCNAMLDKQELVASLAHIVKCYVGIMYASINGLALCYTALKFAHSEGSESERLKGELLSLPQPWTNHECFHPNLLASSRCSDPSNDDCPHDRTPVKICDIYSNFPICAGLDMAPQQH